MKIREERGRKQVLHRLKAIMEARDQSLGYPRDQMILNDGVKCVRCVRYIIPSNAGTSGIKSGINLGKA